jgi:hypothetical protein
MYTVANDGRPTQEEAFVVELLLLLLNCNWVDTRWQQYSTHLHTNSTQNTQNGTYITINKQKKNWEAGRALSLRVTPWNLPKKHGKSSVRVVEECPDIPVVAVQYTYTH